MIAVAVRDHCGLHGLPRVDVKIARRAVKAAARYGDEGFQVKTHEQCANAVLMIRPAAFDYNPETAETNTMQQRPASAAAGANELARAEFAQLARALESEGVSVCVVDDTPAPPKPDAVFPNNWISFHEDGTVVLYPMQAQSRRRERRHDVIDAVAACTGFKLSRVVDLTHHEAQGRFLEGTGSLVLDHVNRVAYASLSPRTHPQVIEEWAQELGYEPLMFESLRSRRCASLSHQRVDVHRGAFRGGRNGSDCTARPGARSDASGSLRARDHRARPRRIERFAGNMLELASWDEALGDCRAVVMSASARAALAPEAFARLSACTDSVVAAPIPTIERLGGGSVRCMIAEVFLPPA